MIETIMSLEEMLDHYVEARHVQEEAEAFAKRLGVCILQALEREQLSVKVVHDHRMLKVERTDFKPTLEQARLLKATEVVEQVNKEKLKRLHQQGVEIPGTVTSTFIRVDEIKSEPD